ncbi:MAG: EAL domain-containing protein, partial [Terracidiphilus sp.]
LSRQLQRAIRRGRIAVLYQPIVELATRRVVGAEALSRWNDEDGYPVSPAIFVRLAEQRGFVHELTKMVLGRALRDFGAELLSQSEFRINVNVTGSDLGDARFVLMAEDAIASSGVAPERVVFEVTEGSTARTQMAIETIHELRRRGHRVEIDDFGTGYSSLSYLRDLAVDAIKIDRSFTQAIGTSAAIGGILPQILSIARSLSLLVIVEGIETAEQAEYFADFEGVVLGQGWLFGRPVSADEFHRLWLRSGANTSTAAAG